MSAIKYEVLDSFKARTKKGEMVLQPGQVITLPQDKALKLITEGRVRSLKEKVQAKFCSWREMAVPADECVKPCYEFNPGEVRECKHLVAWWRQRAKWLQDNGLWVTKHEL